MTTFTERGLNINLNFSDPLLVSAGDFADTVSIKMLKSYFLQPSPYLASELGLYQLPYRNLQSLSKKDGYIVFKEDLPRQARNEEELQTLESTMDAAVDLITAQFVLTFILNLILNGVMTQLWNIFNTM